MIPRRSWLHTIAGIPIFDAGTVNARSGAGPDSYNVLPALLGGKLPDPDRPVVFTSGGTGALAIRMGKWKLIEGQGNRGYGEFQKKKPWPAPKPGDPPDQLYNLEEDLGETRNLHDENPEVVEKLKEIRNAVP